jgi:hypothetical protein
MYIQLAAELQHLLLGTLLHMYESGRKSYKGAWHRLDIEELARIERYEDARRISYHF